MKTIVFSGQPKFLKQEPPKISTYMGAILRRYRFVIIVTICLLMFTMFSWHSHRNHQSVLSITPISHINEKSLGEIDILQPNEQHFSDLTQRSGNIEEELTKTISTRTLPEYDYVSPTVMKIETELPQYRIEEFRPFISKQVIEEVTPVYLQHLDEKFMIGDEYPVMQNPEINVPTTPNVMLEDTKGLHLEAKVYTQQFGEEFTTGDENPTMQHPELNFPAPSNAILEDTKDLHTETEVHRQQLDEKLTIGDENPNMEYPELKLPGPANVMIEDSYLDAKVQIQPLDEKFTIGDENPTTQHTEIKLPGPSNVMIEDSHLDAKLHVQQIDEKFTIGDGNFPMQHTEINLPGTSNVTLEETKDLYLEQSLLPITPIENPISFSDVQQLVEGFPAPNQNNEWENTAVTLSFSDVTSMVSINNDNILNQQESSPTEYSTENKTILLIDTPGCKIPRIDPWDSTIIHLIEKQDPYHCPGHPVFLKSNPGGSISLKKTFLKRFYNIEPEELVCYYQPIYRTRAESSVRERSIMFGDGSLLEFDVPLNEDYVATSCTIHNITYEQYFPLIRLRENVEEERNSKVPPNRTPNVILVGIDSVSKLNFLRHFPKTHAFLNEKLKPFEMNGYTKVADNTFPNLVPMLTGRFVDYWWNETVMDTMFFDNLDFIWKEYAKRGYRTFYAEDSPFTGTFNYGKRGFYDPPTDYYFRPLALAIERYRMKFEKADEFCVNSEMEINIIYDFLKAFTQVMRERPHFGFAMVSTLTHDVLNYAGWADEPTERLLEGLTTSGALNNTILVLFSDHGIRYGHICYSYSGKFEERLPMMYIHAPKWFLDQYPEIEKNLRLNQDRLMTLFDIHATMIHLLDLNKSHAERSVMTLGRSLFEEIPADRTCSDANIEYHFCPCQIYESVPLSDPEVTYASQAIVDDINSKLEPYGGICEILEVDTIMDSRVGKASDIMLTYWRTDNLVVNKTIQVGVDAPSVKDYMLTLVTKPGGGVFEGTVRHYPDVNTYNVLGVNRISMYGNTSWCIDSQKMKIFCYCKIQQLT